MRLVGLSSTAKGPFTGLGSEPPLSFWVIFGPPICPSLRNLLMNPASTQEYTSEGHSLSAINLTISSLPPELQSIGGRNTKRRKSLLVQSTSSGFKRTIFVFFHLRFAVVRQRKAKSKLDAI
jgi:hypothetical protein